MFETSHVRSHVVAQRRYGLLTASLAIHTAVVIALLVASVSSLTFPTAAPSELPRYLEPIRITVPPAYGTRAVARPVPAPAQRPAASVAPATDVTPNRIPDVVQPFPASTVAVDPNAPIGNGPPASDVGDPTGVIGGITIGTPAPHHDDVADRVYQPVGEVHPAVVLRRVDPQYPHAALSARMSGKVVLECVIDKEGHIRDAHVVQSSFSIFDEPALAALRQWTFAPGMLRGQPVDTWFELTVTFQPR